jgi:Ras family protein A
MLLGLKSDLRNKKNCIELLKTQGLTPVTPEQGRAVAKKMGAAYMECSSKEQDGVEEIFDMAVTMASRGNTSAFPAGVGKKKKRSGCKVL